MADDRLLEPLDGFKNYFEKEFEDNSKAYFDDLVEKSHIDVEENRSTVKKYNSELNAANKIGDKLSGYRTLKGFLIFLAIVGFVCGVVGILLLVGGKSLAGGLMLPLGILFGGAMVVVIVAKINPMIRDAEAKKREIYAKADALLKKAWEQMAPLNALFDSNATSALIQKTVPLLKIDDNFNMRRYDYLCGKYGFGENDSINRSTIGILTGEILGNPFVIDREIVHSMGTCTYRGSLIIHWTTSYVDSDGHRHTQHHSQTLVATVTKPKPYYHNETRLIYGNEAAPNLHFSHEPTHAERLTEKQLEKMVRSGSKKLQKQQNKDLKTNASNFTEMSNAEFDVLFNADDRDHEVQYRLLFTPLAQKNMLALMKDSYAFGDDFYLRKMGCLNFITSEHSARWDMDTSYKRYISYDVDAARQKFMDFNRQYFKSIYFDFAPLLSIPLYQQHKPKEYIYSEVYTRNYTSYEAEYAVNQIGHKAFRHHLATTDSILKTQLIKKDGQSDHIQVTAYSYQTVDRVDFVPQLGGDGHIHNVPVNWVEYIPIVSDVNTVKLKELGMTDREFEAKCNSNANFSNVLRNCGNTMAYSHGILSCIVGADDNSFDTFFNKLLNNNNQ